MGRVRQVAGFDSPFNDFEGDEGHDGSDHEVKPEKALSRRGLIKQSPFIDVYYRHHPVRVTTDTGTETNMVCVAWVK